MSTYYFPKVKNRISFKKLKEKMIELKMYEKTEHDNDTSFCISDGKNWLWCYDFKDSVCFGRFGLNDVDKILKILEKYCGEIMDGEEFGKMFVAVKDESGNSTVAEIHV